VVLSDFAWRTPEQLIRIGFERSRVVMMNEAHDGLRRCMRTREVGRRILPVAHEAGVRHLAAEALDGPFAAQANHTRALPVNRGGYLAQPDMRSLLQAALDLGWTLIPYEANAAAWLRQQFPGDFAHLDLAPVEGAAHPLSADLAQRLAPHLQTLEYTNWREAQQARNLVSALSALPADARLLVWCGNGHLIKGPIQDWVPMGAQFVRQAGFEPFVLDQTVTVGFVPELAQRQAALVEAHAAVLDKCGGTAGFLREEAPEALRAMAGIDAFLLSLHNNLA
jgi:hypothetical protein